MAESQRRITEYLQADDERPFIHKAFDHALDDPGRLAYAQLLAERDPERAEWLRLEVALHARATEDPAVLARFLELAHAIGLDYANVMLRDVIMNCGSDDAKQEARPVRFAFRCTKRWETLAPTDRGSVRYCQQCKESVYYCDTVADAETRAFAGQCIAIPKPLSDGGGYQGEAVMGRPDPVRDWADRLFSYGPGSSPASDSLVIIYAKDNGLLGRRYSLNPEGVTVGRSADNTIVLAGEAASRRHARLEQREGGWWVIDDASTNGTYVNEAQIREARLHDGDHLKIGATIFKFLAARR